MQDNATTVFPASFVVRIAAMVYELLLVAAVLFVAGFIALPIVGDLRAPWQRYLFMFYILGVLYAYFSTFWLRSGQTLAMKTWRIRLVGKDGHPPTRKQTLLRFAIAFTGPILASGAWFWWALLDHDRQFLHVAIPFIALLASAGFWWALIDRDRQFLHDRIAGTRLVRVPRKA